MNLVLPQLSKKLFVVVIAGLFTIIFCHNYFNHLRSIPRGDVAIFFATFAILWHVYKIITFLYDLIDTD